MPRAERSGSPSGRSEPAECRVSSLQLPLEVGQESLVAELAARLVEDDAAAFDQNDPIAVLEGQADIVEREDLGLVPCRQDAQDLACLHAIQGRNRLVADQYRPPVEDRARDHTRVRRLYSVE